MTFRMLFCDILRMIDFTVHIAMNNYAIAVTTGVSIMTQLS